MIQFEINVVKLLVKWSNGPCNSLVKIKQKTEVDCFTVLNII